MRHGRSNRHSFRVWSIVDMLYNWLKKLDDCQYTRRHSLDIAILGFYHQISPFYHHNGSIGSFLSAFNYIAQMQDFL